MIKLSELQTKEVIVVDDGSRLGHIADLEIDKDSGKILAIVIIMKEKKSGMFGKPDELIIHWEQIVRVGSDVILVKEVQEPELYAEPFVNE